MTFSSMRTSERGSWRSTITRTLERRTSSSRIFCRWWLTRCWRSSLIRAILLKVIHLWRGGGLNCWAGRGPTLGWAMSLVEIPPPTRYSWGRIKTSITSTLTISLTCSQLRNPKLASKCPSTNRAERRQTKKKKPKSHMEVQWSVRSEARSSSVMPLHSKISSTCSNTTATLISIHSSSQSVLSSPLKNLLTRPSYSRTSKP